MQKILEDYFRLGGINKGDKVLIHSNLKPLVRQLLKNNFKFKADDILDFLINYIGSEGVLIFPTFNFDFCSKKKYSILNSVSQVGLLSELARKKNPFLRTWHPVYSFVIYGNFDYKNIKKNFSAYGKDSIFNWIKENDAKIAIMDLPDQNSMTFYHYVEEILEVDWRYHKIFSSLYENFDGITKKVEASIFVRKIEKNIITNVSGMEKYLWDNDYYVGHKKNSHQGLRSISASLLFNIVKDMILGGKSINMLYSILVK